MELAPIMPTDGAASAIVLARLAESRQRKTAVSVSIFANLLAKIVKVEQNTKKTDFFLLLSRRILSSA